MKFSLWLAWCAFVSHCSQKLWRRWRNYEVPTKSSSGNSRNYFQHQYMHCKSACQLQATVFVVTISETSKKMLLEFVIYLSFFFNIFQLLLLLWFKLFHFRQIVTKICGKVSILKTTPSWMNCNLFILLIFIDFCAFKIMTLAVLRLATSHTKSIVDWKTWKIQTRRQQKLSFSSWKKKEKGSKVERMRKLRFLSFVSVVRDRECDEKKKLIKNVFSDSNERAAA